MTNFEEALKTTLFGINDNFEVADADLHREVAAAAQALARITDGEASMALAQMQEKDEGNRYSLLMTGAGKDYNVGLSTFFVPSRGYPISAHSGGESVTLENKEALSNYLASMASNRDSPLVRTLAFVMRRKGRENQSVP